MTEAGVVHTSVTSRQRAAHSGPAYVNARVYPKGHPRNRLSQREDPKVEVSMGSRSRAPPGEGPQAARRRPLPRPRESLEQRGADRAGDNTGCHGHRAQGHSPSAGLNDVANACSESTPSSDAVRRRRHGDHSHGDRGQGRDPDAASASPAAAAAAAHSLRGPPPEHIEFNEMQSRTRDDKENQKNNVSLRQVRRPRKPARRRSETAESFPSGSPERPEERTDQLIQEREASPTSIDISIARTSGRVRPGPAPRGEGRSAAPPAGAAQAESDAPEVPVRVRNKEGKRSHRLSRQSPIISYENISVMRQQLLRAIVCRAKQVKARRRLSIIPPGMSGGPPGDTLTNSTTSACIVHPAPPTRDDASSPGGRSTPLSRVVDYSSTSSPPTTRDPDGMNDGVHTVEDSGTTCDDAGDVAMETASRTSPRPPRTSPRSPTDRNRRHFSLHFTKSVNDVLHLLDRAIDMAPDAETRPSGPAVASDEVNSSLRGIQGTLELLGDTTGGGDGLVEDEESTGAIRTVLELLEHATDGMIVPRDKEGVSTASIRHVLDLLDLAIVGSDVSPRGRHPSAFPVFDDNDICSVRSSTSSSSSTAAASASASGSGSGSSSVRTSLSLSEAVLSLSHDVSERRDDGGARVPAELSSTAVSSDERQNGVQLGGVQLGGVQLGGVQLGGVQYSDIQYSDIQDTDVQRGGDHYSGSHSGVQRSDVQRDDVIPPRTDNSNDVTHVPSLADTAEPRTSRDLHPDGNSPRPDPVPDQGQGQGHRRYSIRAVRRVQSRPREPLTTHRVTSSGSNTHPRLRSSLFQHHRHGQRLRQADAGRDVTRAPPITGAGSDVADARRPALDAPLHVDVDFDRTLDRSPPPSYSGTRRGGPPSYSRVHPPPPYSQLLLDPNPPGYLEVAGDGPLPIHSPSPPPSEAGSDPEEYCCVIL